MGILHSGLARSQRRCHNRGFSEIGVNGLRAQELANIAQQDAIRGQDEQVEALRTGLERVSGAVERTFEQLKSEMDELKEEMESGAPDSS